MTDDRAAKLRSLAIDREGSKQETTRPGRRLFVIAAFAAVLIAGLGIGFVLIQSPGSADGAVNGPETRAEGAAEDAGTRQVAQAEPAGVKTAQTDTQTQPRALRRGGLVASGYVVARRRATVSPQVSGQLESLLVEEGAKVTAGEPLAYLDSEIAEHELDLNRANVQAARAELDAIRADLREAERTLTRTRDLEGNEFSSVASLDTAEARVASLKARLASAEAQLAAAEASAARQAAVVERFTVRAPFDGVVIDKNAQPGEFVAPASAGGEFTRTGVYTIVDMSSLEIEVDVNEGQINRVSVDQPVEAVLDAYTDWSIPARVLAIIPTANRSRATIQVRVGFESLDERILPEMAAKVTFLEDNAREGGA